jgi:hypothetical protein
MIDSSAESIRPTSTAADDITHWKPARKFPEHYPGECPATDYLLWNSRVNVLEHSREKGFVLPGPGTRSLDETLSQLGLPRLDERIPILAYGANRNPATLHIKLINYGYAPPNGIDYCLPVLRGTLTGADVAACGIHGHGYLYGELLLNTEYSRDTELDVRICMVDPDQLRVLNESEGIREGRYHLARIPGVRINAWGRSTVALGYVADARTWLSPVHRTPIGFSAVPAKGRRYPAMTATEGLEHVLNALDLRPEISAMSGLANNDQLAAELAKYLNGQWWYGFNTAQPPILGYENIMGLMRARMSESELEVRTFDYLEELGHVIPVSAAYSPEQRLTWAQLGTQRPA